MYQIVIVKHNSYNNLSELFNIASQASDAFMSDALHNSAYPYEKYDGYSCVNADGLRKVYTNKILDELSYNAFMLGKQKFYIKETFINGEIVEAEEVDNELVYECVIPFDQDVYEDWIKQGKPKDMYETFSFEDLYKVFDNLGLFENRDYYPIHRDNEIVAIGCKPLYPATNAIITKNLIKL